MLKLNAQNVLFGMDTRTEMFAPLIIYILEYAVPVWHHLITKTQADNIEAIQKRAIRIIFSLTNDMPYTSALYVANIPTLADRREQLHPTSCLHSLLPPTPRPRSTRSSSSPKQISSHGYKN